MWGDSLTDQLHSLQRLWVHRFCNNIATSSTWRLDSILRPCSAVAQRALISSTFHVTSWYGVCLALAKHTPGQSRAWPRLSAKLRDWESLCLWLVPQRWTMCVVPSPERCDITRWTSPDLPLDFVCSSLGTANCTDVQVGRTTVEQTIIQSQLSK